MRAAPAAGKPRVVLLHPHCFSERDMQFYVPLLDEFDIVAVTPRWQPERRNYGGIPQCPLVSLDQVVGAVGPVQATLDRLLRLRSENLYHFFGLTPLLSSAAIVECLETFHPYCLQALNGKSAHGYRLAFSVHENIAGAHENLALRREIKRRAFAEGDAFFTLCEQGRNSLILEGAPPERIHRSGMGVDADRYAPGPPDPTALGPLGLTACTDAPTLLFAGRLVWEKGVFDAVEAVGLLAREGVACRLLIAGDGPERDALEARIRRVGVGDRVRLLGRVTSDQMIALYRLAGLCLVPSIPTRKWQEQFGCVLIEAMACGCPVVATDSGAIREVTGAHAALVAPSHHTELAGAIAALLAAPARRREMADGGRAHVVATHDNKAVADRIRTVYRSLLNRASSGEAMGRAA